MLEDMYYFNEKIDLFQIRDYRQSSSAHASYFSYITTAVILSHPIPPEEATSKAIILSKIYSKQVLKLPFDYELCIKSLT